MQGAMNFCPSPECIASGMRTYDELKYLSVYATSTQTKDKHMDVVFSLRQHD